MKHTIYIMCRAARAAARMASVRAARMTSTRAALLLVATLLLAAACTNEQDLPAPIAPDGFPADGRLGIGQLLISGNNPNDYRSRKPLEGADTRIINGATGWEEGDDIRVTATAKTGGTLVAYYAYRADGTWEQFDAPDYSRPEITPNDTYPLYIDDIDRTQPIRVESWGGLSHNTEKDNPTNYTDQGSIPNGVAYYYNDHILCPTATLHTAADAANGITRGSLTGTLAHQRVAVDVRVFTDDAHPLSADDIDATQLRLILPDSYSTSTAGSPASLRTWLAPSTPAEGGQKAYTTFRAYVKLADLPGASAPQQDEQGQYVTITPESPMGTLQYATTVGGVTLPGSGKLALRYSVSTSASGQPTPVRPGTRLTVDVDFTSLKNPVLTATLSPWQEVEGGDLPTYDDVATADGTQPLDPAIFNPSRPNWIVTGGGTPEADAAVMQNVCDALNRIYKPLNEDGRPNELYTGTDRIDLTLTGVDRIENVVFHRYGQLRSISLPKATSIGNSAFNNCTALKRISLPKATTIGNQAFQNCDALTTVSLPKATSIGNQAFYNCDALITVSLPAATSIGGYAFYYCPALATVNLPVATSIGNDAFLSCPKLITVTLPAATTIGNDAFNYCDALTNASLPKATTIGIDAFRDCAALITLTLPAATTIGSDAFNNCNALATLSLTAAGNFTLHADAFNGNYHPNCTLTLNPDKQPDVVGNSWAGKTWKAITYAQP